MGSLPSWRGVFDKRVSAQELPPTSRASTAFVRAPPPLPLAVGLLPPHWLARGAVPQRGRAVSRSKAPSVRRQSPTKRRTTQTAMELFSLQSKNRVDSFDSIDSDFEVVSIGESVEERIGVEDAETEVEMQDGEEVLVEHESDEEHDDDEWDTLDRGEPSPEDVDVEIELNEGFEDAIEAALESSIPAAVATGHQAGTSLVSPRWRTAREALRSFYLARAKTSEENSKHYRSYTPAPFVAPVEIAPLRAPQRYDVELYERVVREDNERKAQQALRDFYAERDAAKAQRAAENRANERLVYDSQIGSSVLLGGGSCTKDDAFTKVE